MFSKGFDATKLKATLRLCSSRFDVAKHKKAALMKENMREVAMLLAEEPPKEEKARIRTERLIKDDHLIEAYEILQLECQLLVERVGLLKHSNECPTDLVPCVSDLIYAAPRVEISELGVIRKQLVAKFGKNFSSDAERNKDGVVSQRIVEKLSLAPPTSYLVQTYMDKIAKLHQVSYEPTIQLTLEEAFEPIAAPVGYSVPVAQGTGIGPADKTPPSVGVCWPHENLKEVPSVASIPPSENPGFCQSSVAKALAYAQENDIPDMDSAGKMPASVSPPTAPEESNSNSSQKKHAVDLAKETINAHPIAPPAHEANNPSNEQYVAVTGLSHTENKTGGVKKYQTPRDVTGGYSYELAEEAKEPVNHDTKDNMDDLIETNEKCVNYTLAEAGPKQKADSSIEVAEGGDHGDSPSDDADACPAQVHERLAQKDESSELRRLRDRFAMLSGDVSRTQSPHSLTRGDRDVVEDNQDALLTAPQAASEDLDAPSVVDVTEDVAANTTHAKLQFTEPTMQVHLQQSIEKNVKEQVAAASIIIEIEKDARSIPAPEVPLGTSTTSRDTSSHPEYITGAALAGGALGVVVAGPLGGLLGAAGLAHLAATNKGGKAANLARKCGKTVTKMTNKLVDEIERANTKSI